MAGADLLGSCSGRVQGGRGALRLLGLLAVWRCSLFTDEETEAQGLEVTRLVRAGLDLNPSFSGQAALALQPIGQGGKVWESSMGGSPSPAHAWGERWPVSGTAGC